MTKQHFKPIFIAIIAYFSVFVLMFLTGCENNNQTSIRHSTYKIYKKEYSIENRSSFVKDPPLPKDICLFTYDGERGYEETQDSCNKYSIGDIMPH